MSLSCLSFIIIVANKPLCRVSLCFVLSFAHIAHSSRALVTFSPATKVTKLCVFVTAFVTKQARVFVRDQPNVYFQGFSVPEPYTAQGQA